MTPFTIISAEINGMTGVVIIEGPTQESVTTADAKRAVLNAASAKLSKPGLSDLPPPYPVNDKGETNDDVVFARNGQKVAAFRCNYRVMGSV